MNPTPIAHLPPAISRRNDPNAYRPARNSKAHQVCTFFLNAPDEELTRADIAVKFSMPPSGVDSALAGCVTAQLLRLKMTDDGRVWTAGPALADWKPDTAPPDRSNTASPARLPLLDMASVVVRADLPLPQRNHNKGQTLYDPVLEKLTAVGMSATFPRQYQASLTKASAAFGKRCTPPRKYAIRLVDQTTAGVWRIA